MEFLKRMFRKKKAEETLKKERKPDIRREFINGEWREVRHYSEDERLVPMSYSKREAMKLTKEMLGTKREMIEEKRRLMKERERLKEMIPLESLISEKVETFESSQEKPTISYDGKDSKIQIIEGIEGTHSQLMNYAIKMLSKDGYEVYPEFEFVKGKQSIRIDILGVKGKEKVAVECGTLSIPDKLEILAKGFDRVIWIPYADRPLEEQQKR